MARPIFSSPESISSIASRSSALRNRGSRRARSRIVSRKSLVSAILLLLCLPFPVVFPVQLRPPDIQLLALFRATAKQNDEPSAFPSKIDAVAGAEVNPVFENAAANTFDVRQVAVRNAFQRRGHFRGGLHVQRAQPLRKRATSADIDVFPN